MSNHWFSHKSLDDRKGVDRRRVLLSGGSLLASSALMGEALNTATGGAANAQASAATPTALPSDQIGEVATNAYIYAYPLIMMELTRRISTNVADTRQFSKAPMNQFANVPAFPDATFTDIARANVDTLYSLMWFDVSKEPLLISSAGFGRALLSAADARHVDRRFPIHRQAHDWDERPVARDRGAALARPTPCRRYARS